LAVFFISVFFSPSLPVSLLSLSHQQSQPQRP